MGKKFISKLNIKITLDIFMTVVLLMLYNKKTNGMRFHEIAGLVLFGLFLVHNLLNWKWVKTVTVKFFKKTSSSNLRISWIVNMLLFLSMTGIIVTGLMIAKTIPINIGRWPGAQQWHYFLSAVSIILMGIHLGLHWPFIKGLLSKISFLPKKVSSAMGVLFLISALIWGSYSLFTGSFSNWIVAPFTTPDFQKVEHINEHRDKIPTKDFKFDKEAPDGERPGKGLHRGEGKGLGMGEQSLSRIEVLGVIATYGAEMIVFAFITVLALGRRR